MLTEFLVLSVQAPVKSKKLKFKVELQSRTQKELQNHHLLVKESQFEKKLKDLIR